MTQWGSDLGLHVLDLLSQLYTALVWESTILLTLCCQDTTLGIRREDMEKLCPFEKGLVSTFVAASISQWFLMLFIVVIG